MATYPHFCQKGHDWDVITSIASRDDPQTCPECGGEGRRDPVVRVNFTGASDWNTQSYNPGLGCYTRNNKDAERIAKSRGLEPVGNETPAAMEKHFSAQRKETKERRWEEAARDKVFGD